MAFGKIKPRKVSAEALQSLATQAQAQRFFNVVPKSEDPENYPVFGLGENTYFVYVPNHVVVNEEGEETLRWDAPFIHTLVDGKSYPKVRCAEGVVHDDLGLDGTCPICDNLGIVNEVAEMEARQAKIRAGFDENDDSDAAKQVSAPFFSSRIMKKKARSYTFPIVVFEREATTNEKGKTIYSLVKDKDGKFQYRVMWYTVSESMYNDTWKQELDKQTENSEEDIFTTPAGLWFTIKGTYALKPNEKWSARDAARKFTVAMANPPKDLGNEDEAIAFEKALDELTAEWTPEKAIEMVIANHFLPVEDVQVEVDRLIQPLKDKLALASLGNLNEPVATVGIETSAPTGGADALLALDTDDLDD